MTERPLPVLHSGERIEPGQLRHLRDVLAERGGVYYDDARLGSLAIAVAERTRAAGTPTLEAYRAHLLSGWENEFRRLMEAVVVGETSFFRHSRHFDALRQSILPELLTRKRSTDQRLFRIWSAGCATGEEPYSLAVVAGEVIEAAPDAEDWTLDVLATDVSERSLEFARRGHYSARAMERVPLGVRQRYVHPHGRGYAVNERLRRIVRFGYLNLVQQPWTVEFPAGPKPVEFVDVVSCQNVLIYFRPELIRRIVEGFADILRPGGYLLLGHSESLWQVTERFELVNHDGSYVYRLPREGRAASHAVRPLPSPEIDFSALKTGAGMAETVDTLTRLASLAFPLPLGGRGDEDGSAGFEFAPFYPSLGGRGEEEPGALSPSFPLPPSGRGKASAASQGEGAFPPLLPSRREGERSGALSPSSPRPPGGRGVGGESQPLASPRPPSGRGAGGEGRAIDRALERLFAGDRAAAADVDRRIDELLATPEQALTAAQAAADAGETGLALAWCARLAQREPLLPAAHLLMADLGRRSGQPADAIRAYRRVLYLEPDTILAHLHLADLLREQGDQVGAARSYRNALARLGQREPGDTIGEVSVGMLADACRRWLARLEA